MEAAAHFTKVPPSVTNAPSTATPTSTETPHHTRHPKSTFGATSPEYQDKPLSSLPNPSKVKSAKSLPRGGNVMNARGNIKATPAAEQGDGGEDSNSVDGAHAGETQVGKQCDMDEDFLSRNKPVRVDTSLLQQDANRTPQAETPKQPQA